MSAALADVHDVPSEALRLAVRAQHLQRWKIPRDDYPRTTPGYHAWRNDQKNAHAELACETLRRVGYDGATLARVASLVRKRNLGRDPEAQALEDAACVVFLETQLTAFAAGRDEEELIRILQKTWSKMSERGRARALAAPLGERARALLERALQDAGANALQSGPMSVEDVASHLQRVDKAVLKSKKVTDDDMAVNITDLFFRYKWGGTGPTPLPEDALKRLSLVDRTTDSRWLGYFDGNGRHLGVYRTIPGYYWLLRYDAALTQHWLEHVGTAADVDERYGKR